MKERLTQQTIALRAVKELKDGDYVNLGVGIPNLCAMFIPPDKEVIFEAEQGVLGYGTLVLDTEAEKVDFDYVDGGVVPFSPQPGLCFFDIDLSFDMIRGKHLDASIMGGLEVSEKGDLANWTRGGAAVAGVGGAPDLAVGAKRVIILMEHTTKKDEPRIVKECKFPLTAKECVNLVITDLAVIEVTEQGLLLKEVAPGWSVEEIQALTEPKLIVSKELKEMEL